MNIIENDFIKKEIDELHNKFIFYSNNVFTTYDNCKSKICSWEYSLGASRDIIPFERLVPSVNNTQGRVLEKMTKSSRESKNLVAYGFNNDGRIILSKRKFDKDVEKYGENVRMVDGCFILNAHIYESYPEKNKLLSICYSYERDSFHYYLSISPPRDWFVRIDKIINNKIIKSSIFATNWFKQIDFDFIYDDADNLTKIMIDDFTHWKSN